MITGVICSYHDEDSSSELSQAVLKSSSSRHGWLQQIPVCRAESSKPSLRVNTTGLAPQLHPWFPIPWLPGHTHSPPGLCRHWPGSNANRQRLVEEKEHSTERRLRQRRIRSPQHSQQAARFQESHHCRPNTAKQLHHSIEHLDGLLLTMNAAMDHPPPADPIPSATGTSSDTHASRSPQCLHPPLQSATTASTPCSQTTVSPSSRARTKQH